MKDSQRKKIIDKSWELHQIVESSYLENPATKGDEEWLEKQRLLLADMSLHLLQTSLKPGEIELENLKNNLNAIMTISHQFLPEAGLKKATGEIYD